MSHDAEQLLGAYALGALESEERAAVEQHLAGCTSCRRLLEDYQQVADGLLHLTASRVPDPALRARLAEATASDELVLGPHGRRSEPGGLARALGVLRGRRTAWAGLGLALVAANLYLFAQVRALSAQTERLLAEQQVNQTAMAVMSYPNSRVASLEQASIRGSFIYDDSLTLGVLNVWGLEPLAADMAYQLWLIDQNGERSSGGLLTPTEQGAFASLVVWSPVEFEMIQSIGLTIEPTGGSPAPTGPRVLGTDLVHSP